MDDYGWERILILADSRGTGIREQLLEIASFNFQVIVRKGSPTNEIVTRSWAEVSSYKPTQVYIVTGICSITSLNVHNHTISARYADVREAVQLYGNDMQHTEQQVYQAVFPLKPKIIFAPIIGVDIAKFNKWTFTTDYQMAQQQLINDCVKELNSVITQWNSARGLRTPWLQRTIHRNKKGKTTNGYYKLAPDGCHLDQSLREIWVNELDLAVKKNSLLQPCKVLIGYGFSMNQ